MRYCGRRRLNRCSERQFHGSCNVNLRTFGKPAMLARRATNLAAIGAYSRVGHKVAGFASRTGKDHCELSTRRKPALSTEPCPVASLDGISHAS